MQKWEYEYKRFDLPNDITTGVPFMEELEKLGNEGWELIHSFEHRSIDPNSFWHVMCIFKRPKVEYSDVNIASTKQAHSADANDNLHPQNQGHFEKAS